MPQKPQVNPTIDIIAKHAATRGVIVYLDGDNTSHAALSGQKYHFNARAKQLTIVVDKLTVHESEAVMEIVRTYLEKHSLVLDEEQEQILESYEGYSETNPYTDLLKLFEGKIPGNDLNALKMSLFMKIEKENGHSIEEYKQQIRDRFGNRGAYIANLCNAGYYEGAFRTQCLKLSAEKFTDYYELRVGKELAALFVHSGLTMGPMRESFLEKIDLCLLNGISKYQVLGFGRKNVELIDEFKLQCDIHDWTSVEIEWQLRYENRNPPVGLEYDIIIP